MNKFLSFFKTASPLIIFLIGAIIGIIAKSVENISSDFAMGLQLVSFALLIYAIIKYFNSK